MNVGLFGDLGAAHVHDDELHAAGLRGEKTAEEAVGLRPCAVLADDHQALGLRAHAAGDFTAVGEFERMHHGEVAGHRAFAAVVRRAEVARKAHDGRTRLLRVAAVEHHAVGAVLGLHGRKPFGDGLDRLVPRDADPARVLGALGCGALDRIE